MEPPQCWTMILNLNESLDQQLYTWNSPLFPPLPQICSHFGSIQGHSDSMYIYILNASQKYQCDSLELHMTEFFSSYRVNKFCDSTENCRRWECDNMPRRRLSGGNRVMAGYIAYIYHIYTFLIMKWPRMKWGLKARV